MNHGPDEKGPEGLDSDELALRRLLHSAVEDVEPRDGTLDHLRRAVPARRARKRQAAVGMAAAALFIGTAIPALIHVSNSSDSPNTSMAGQASQAQGGTGDGKYPDGGAAAGASSGQTSGKGKSGKKSGGKGRSGGSGGGSTGGAGPSATTSTGVPACTAAQLGSATGSADAPDSAGVVYGTFRIANVSATSCTIGGPGSLSVLAQGAAEPGLIGTARHVSGDAATGLPDPSLEVTGLVLAPGSAYTEKFAFVPSQTCPTTGGDSGGTGAGGSTGGGTPGGATTGGDPSADPSPTPQAADGGGATDTGALMGTSPQMMVADGTADGSIMVTLTPQTATPMVSATVPNACAGTVYWTGVLAGA